MSRCRGCLVFEILQRTRNTGNFNMFGRADNHLVKRCDLPISARRGSLGSFLSAAARMIAAERFAIQPNLRINFKKGP